MKQEEIYPFNSLAVFIACECQRIASVKGLRDKNKEAFKKTAREWSQCYVQDAGGGGAASFGGEVRAGEHEGPTGACRARRAFLSRATVCKSARQCSGEYWLELLFTYMLRSDTTGGRLPATLPDSSATLSLVIKATTLMELMDKLCISRGIFFLLFMYKFKLVLLFVCF